MSERDRFSRLDALFDEALDLDTEERDAFVARLRGEDPDLADDLASLLRATEESDSLLDQPPDAGDAPPAESGEQVGPWRLIRPIGQGGMGSVFLAERSDGSFDRKVALKLLRGEQGRLARAFALERKALARLDHPGIARLLDAGIDARGRPYLAMAWVDGLELRTWCRDRKASLERRLGLFLDICEAVAYAHRNLVVHRDIKPRNILVDGDGRPRLLDFGIAKLIDPDGGDTTTVAALTPDYAAPEQLCGEPIGTHTDVYALGALLHTLLCDAPPLPTAGLSLAEIIHRICRQTPPTPSAHATARATAAPIPASRLRGDMDAIVGRALAKEPDRRYESVDALADDVRRFLHSRPVRARPATVGYRLRRYLRRHRGSVAAAAVLVAAVTAGILGYQRQTEQARTARAAALIEVERATAVRDFLQILLRDVDDDARYSTRELLERASEDIDFAYADRPRMRVQYLLAIIAMHLLRGDYVAGEATLERLFAGNLEGVPAQLLAEAHCDRAHASVRRGKAESAAADLERAWTLLDRVAQPNADPARADCLMIESQRLRLQGDALGSLAPMREALRIRLAREPADSIAVGIVRTNLGTVFNALGRFDEAGEEFAIALDILDRHGRGHTADAANLQNNLAAVAFAQGHLTDAENRFRAAIDMRRRLFGQSAALGALLNNRGKLLLVLGRIAEAAPLIEEAVELQQRFTGEDSVETALLLGSLAELREAQDELDAAADAAERSLATLENKLGESHLLTLRSKVIALRIDGRRHDPAAAALALSAIEGAFAERNAMADSVSAVALGHAARLSLGSDQPEAAEHQARRALELHGTRPDGHWEVASIRRVLAEALLEQGRAAEARTLLDSALPVLRATLGAAHVEVARGEALHARALSAAD